MKDKLRTLPSVDELLRDHGLKCAIDKHSAALVTVSARKAVEAARAALLSGSIGTVEREWLITLVLDHLSEALAPSVRKVINASGTVLHTNIGRAVLPREAVEAIILAAEGNINLEFDLAGGERGERDDHIEGLIKKLTGAEAAVCVNNNAAAVLLALNTLAESREVIISRGELIEIGGSFRLPDIIRKSGCVLKEVGTTNRTHPKDYEEAVNANTALILKAHTSNYRVVGFTAEVSLKELAAIGQRHNIPVVEDLGSGSLADLAEWGLPPEPVVSERIASGAGVVTFSGDKLLGGPQAGILAGKKELIDKIRKNPLKRAMRADKLTIAALEATLRLYLNKERLSQSLPTLKYLARPLKEIEKTAFEAQKLLKEALPGYDISVEDNESVAGGGALPGHTLPTKAVSITHRSDGPQEVYRLFLSSDPPILGRINKDRFMLDMRTIDSAADVIPKKTGRL